MSKDALVYKKKKKINEAKYRQKSGKYASRIALISKILW